MTKISVAPRNNISKRYEGMKRNLAQLTKTRAALLSLSRFQQLTYPNPLVLANPDNRHNQTLASISIPRLSGVCTVSAQVECIGNSLTNRPLRRPRVLYAFLRRAHKGPFIDTSARRWRKKARSSRGNSRNDFRHTTSAVRPRVMTHWHRVLWVVLKIGSPTALYEAQSERRACSFMLCVKLGASSPMGT